MKVITVENYEEMSALSAEILSELIASKPTAVLGLATGSTSLGTYAKLCKKFNEGAISFRNIKTVNLDEYVGLDKDDAQSYAHFMKVNLFNKVDVCEDNTHIPSGLASDLQAECESYDALLDSLPRDIQLLGLGSDGHIAFNEPFSPFDARTRVVQLDESTIVDNSRLFDSPDEVPRSAISMGIADIMKSRRLLLLASGANKAQAVRDMVKGKVSTKCPASVLQLHDDAIVIVDKDAASLL